MGQDIVFITIDSWRYDALNQMDRLLANTRNWSQTTAISHSSKTYLSFPAILSSSLYTETYTSTGEVQSDTQSLPQILSNYGYNTSGFVGANPNVQQWASHFDDFWNDNIESPDQHYNSKIQQYKKRIMKTLLFQKQVSASELTERVNKWYTNTPTPRFVWVHLMEPHFPYNPGIKKAFGVGLINSYMATMKYHQDRQNISEQYAETLNSLYWRTIERLDEQITDLLKLINDDAIVIITGDHGEEFDHAIATHRHLYEECTKVPFLAKNLTKTTLPDELRHIDIAPTILEEVTASAPEAWRGHVPNTESGEQITPLVNIEDDGTVYVGMRTARQKLIRTYVDEKLVQTELYDLNRDPNEINNLINEQEPPDHLETRLDEFVEQNEINKHGTQSAAYVSDVAADRLKELGYL